MDDTENKLSYIDDEGNEVRTSQFLKNRGTCCKTNCLHCPYGFTLKNYSIEILPLEEKDLKLANEILKEAKPEEVSELTSSLLSGVFGSKPKSSTTEITQADINDYALGTFKGVICSVIEYTPETRLSESNTAPKIKTVHLRTNFQNQGLATESINR